MSRHVQPQRMRPQPMQAMQTMQSMQPMEAMQSLQSLQPLGMQPMIPTQALHAVQTMHPAQAMMPTQAMMPAQALQMQALHSQTLHAAPEAAHARLSGPARAAPDALVKLQGLPGSACAGLRFYSTQLPLSIGRGARATTAWAVGSHCAVSEDSRIARKHLLLDYVSASGMYELRVSGGSGALVDGHRYVQGAVVRVLSGSCVLVGDAELCLLFPERVASLRGHCMLAPGAVLSAAHMSAGGAPISAGTGHFSAGGSVSSMALLAARALRERPQMRASMVELESAVRAQCAPACEGWAVEWKRALWQALEAHAKVFVAPQLPGGIWELNAAAAKALIPGFD